MFPEDASLLYEKATIYAVLNDYDNTILFLIKCTESDFGYLSIIRTESIFDKYRERIEFKRLMGEEYK